MTTEPLLNLSKVVEPFDLTTALRYMKENGEFIRFKNDDQDFYMYLSTEPRPVMSKGKRQLLEITSIRAFDRWQTAVTTLELHQLFETSFSIMRFDEEGEPLWNDPLK